MCCRSILTTLLVGIALTGDASAGPFSRKPNKPDPAEQVPALIKTLQADNDEKKRQAAAEELREYDLKTYPAIIESLIEALKNDPSNGVRHEAADSISKMRPITQQAVYAMVQAASKDNSFWVRNAARQHLGYWRVVYGVRVPAEGAESPLNQTGEPPMAEPLPKIGKTVNAVPASNKREEKPDSARPAPPLMPTPTKRSLFPLFSRSNKPETKEEGPALNAPK